MTGWQEIAAEVLRRIHAKTWPPGTAIPHEAALATEFGVARATVNRALQSLAEQGWIDRRRRAGSRVLATPIRRATLRIPVIRAEVEALGLAYRHALLDRGEGPAPDDVAAALGLSSGQPLWHIRALHLAGDAPYAAETRWVNPAAVPDLARADLTAVSANEWLVRNAPMSHGDAVLDAVAAGDDAARLAVAPATPVLSLTRTTWDGDRSITWVRLVFRPGHRIRAEL